MKGFHDLSFAGAASNAMSDDGRQLRDVTLCSTIG
jgi:hypothetical protein